MTPPWQFTTWLDALDHWQTLAAGLIAIVAAVIAVSVPEVFARRRDKRVIEALRASLAGEIRLYVDLLTNTREMLTRPDVLFQFTVNELQDHRQRDLRDLAVLHPPNVYPAAADRLGLIKRPRAAYVVEFYAQIERLNFSARAMTNEPTKAVSASNYETLVNLFGTVCVSALPLLSDLPSDERDGARRAKIEAIDAERRAKFEVTSEVSPGIGIGAGPHRR
jgi:hypothetical protein